DNTEVTTCQCKTCFERQAIDAALVPGEDAGALLRQPGHHSGEIGVPQPNCYLPSFLVFVQKRAALGAIGAVKLHNLGMK
ncbi:MAG TPA: hypothetical protein VJN69_03860, partial [Candidatus Acidoferrales bacterium]|nr:hypothetical protein [Candidatus Acidoferrales bacterium]